MAQRQPTAAACGSPQSWLSLAGVPKMMADALQALATARPRQPREFLAEFFAAPSEVQPHAPSAPCGEGECPLGPLCPAAAALREALRQLGEQREQLRRAEAPHAARVITAQQVAAGAAREGDGCGGALLLTETVAALRAWGLAQAQGEAVEVQLRDQSRAQEELTRERDYVRCMGDNGERIGEWAEYCQVRDKYQELRANESESSPWEAKQRVQLWNKLCRWPRQRVLLSYGRREERLSERIQALRSSRAEAAAAVEHMRGRFRTLRDQAQTLIGPTLGRSLATYSAVFAEVHKAEPDALAAIADAAADVNRGADPSLLRQRGEGPPTELAFLRGLYAEGATLSARGALEEALREAAGAALAAGHECTVVGAAMKAPERSLQKTMEEYSGDYSRLCDIVRGSLVCETAAGVQVALRHLSTSPALRLLRVKNRLDPAFDAEPSGGYRDVLVNCVLPPSEHVAELQLHVARLAGVKSGGGHAVYSIARSLHLNTQSSQVFHGACTEDVVARIASGAIREAAFDETELAPDMQRAIAAALVQPQCALRELSLAACANFTEAFCLDLPEGFTNSSVHKVTLTDNDKLSCLPPGAWRLCNVEWDEEWRRRVTDEVLAGAASAPGRTELDVRKCCLVTEAGLIRAVAAMGNLAVLRIEQLCDRFSSDGVARALEAARRPLRSVYLRRALREIPLDDAVLRALGPRGRCLEVCDLCHGQGASQVTDDGVAALAKGCPVLNVLNLDGAKEITDAAVQALCAADCHRTLRDLRLRGCKNITNAAAAALAAACPQLEHVDLSGRADQHTKKLINPKVTDDGVAALAQGCKGLRTVHLPTRCTDVGLLQLAQLRRLEMVSMKRCPDITAAGIHQLVRDSASGLKQGSVLGSAERIADEESSAVLRRCRENYYCTHQATRGVYVRQPLWSCSCNSFASLKGFCTGCAVRCHQGPRHQLRAPRWTRCFCDCGAADGTYAVRCTAAEHQVRSRLLEGRLLAAWWTTRNIASAQLLRRVMEYMVGGAPQAAREVERILSKMPRQGSDE
eukprot:TRINITY_DN16580_c0_g1_i1.p1 TRINITY_DN16580_c0_g1~~TRINITY_DN16580_c0_g1_i1.p1  ORF type:complete len:1079 (+),score=323.79 TRINITY_DN16580_c0_g1_i1:136-3237(+)